MDLSTLVRRAIGARLDVQEARDAIDDAVRDEAVAEWNQLPPLSADVSYTQRGIGSADGGLDPLLGGWRFGLSTTYALDHAASAATAAAASVSVAAARRRAGQVEARATAEVRRLYAASRAADTTVALQHDAAALAARELQLANLRFERGLASSLDVVSAQDGLLQAENAEIAAELDRTASLLDLRRATGQLELGELQP